MLSSATRHDRVNPIFQLKIRLAPPAWESVATITLTTQVSPVVSLWQFDSVGVFFVAPVLFRKHPFEPMCLSVSEPLIHERGIVTDEKLFATTITPERSHFLETRRFFLALTPPYCHGLHLLNFSGSAQLGLLPLSPSAPLLGLASHGRAERRPTYIMSNHQTRRAPTAIATTMMALFLSPWLTSWFQIFLHPTRRREPACQATRKLASDARAVPPLWSGSTEMASTTCPAVQDEPPAPREAHRARMDLNKEPRPGDAMHLASVS